METEMAWSGMGNDMDGNGMESVCLFGMYCSFGSFQKH